MWAGLVGDDRSVVVGYSNGSAEVFDMKPGVLNDKTPKTRICEGIYQV